MIPKARIRSFYETFISLKGEPKSIAAGLAMGVLVGVTPTIPFHTAIIVLLGLLFRQNLTAAYCGSWIVSNPVSIPILYFAQYQLGSFLLGMAPGSFSLADYSLESIARMGARILIPLQLGGIITAPIFALPAYFIALRLIKAIRQKERT